MHLLVVNREFDERPREFNLERVADSLEICDDLVSCRLSPLRLLRPRDDLFYRFGSPKALGQVRDKVRESIVRHRIDRVLVFGGGLAEVVIDTGCPRIAIDVCDSESLRQRRQLEFGRSLQMGVPRLRDRLALFRVQRSEALLPSRFRVVFSINDTDSSEIVSLSGGRAHNVITIPNGINEEYLLPPCDEPTRRGVAFWGNLAFPPNAAAVEFIYHQIYVPYLRPAGVELCVIGGGAPTWLSDAAAHDGGLVVTGFVSDLVANARRFPVMLNPMFLGGGMKNKVLEAFGLGLVVVSNAIGIESFSGAEPNRHYLPAETPQEFAVAISSLLDDIPRRRAMREAAVALLRQNFTWSFVGRTWRQSLDEFLV